MNDAGQIRKILLMHRFLIIFVILLSFATQTAAQSLERGEEAFENGDFETALKEFTLVSEAGNARVQVFMGIMYDDGIGVELDKNEAVRWFKLSADQGYVFSQMIMGTLLYDGDGVEKDVEKSLEYLMKAAEQNLADAQWKIGQIYEDIDDGARSAFEAVNWYRLAADQGHAPAQSKLGERYLKDGWLIDNIKMQEMGLMWSVIAMLQGYEPAEFNVMSYENRFNEDSINRIKGLVNGCFENNFIGCEE